MGHPGYWLTGDAGLGLRLGFGFVQAGDVDGGLGFGDGAVVDLNLSWFAGDEQVRGGGSAGGDEDALGDGVGGGADGYRNLSRGVAVVGEVDGDEPGAGFFRDGEDAGDGEVRQTLVGGDPVGEEGGESGAGGGWAGGSGAVGWWLGGGLGGAGFVWIGLGSAGRGRARLRIGCRN